MKPIHRFAALLLALCLLCGCAPQVGRETPVVSFYIYIPTTDDEVLEMIAAELDRYVYETLGFHVQLHSPEDYHTAMSEALRQGEPADVCMIHYNVASLAEEGLLRPLDALLETEGHGIREAIHPSYIEDARIDGALYAFPTNRDRHTSYGFAYNRDIAEEYGLDLSGVTKLEDLTPVFAQLNAVSDIYPTTTVFRTTRYQVVDSLSDGCGVLMLEDAATVVNQYDTAAFTELAEHLYQWNQAGYMLDYTLENGDVAYYLGSGQVLGVLSEGHALHASQESKFSQGDIAYIPLTAAYYNSSNASRLGYAIPKTATHPHEAMELLNLLYTDSYAANLLMYGVEGIHFVRSEEDPSVLTYPENRSPEHYTGMNPWQYCNQYAADRWDCYPADIWDKVEQANLSAIRSPAVGFVFDDTAVSRQLHDCSEVINEYLPLVKAGIVDPAQLLPQFRQALQEAGIDEVS